MDTRPILLKGQHPIETGNYYLPTNAILENLFYWNIY